MQCAIEYILRSLSVETKNKNCEIVNVFDNSDNLHQYYSYYNDGKKIIVKISQTNCIYLKYCPLSHTDGFNSKETGELAPEQMISVNLINLLLFHKVIYNLIIQVLVNCI
jgi:hypothetical protein